MNSTNVSDIDCCETCKWAAERTGLAGTSPMNRPWIIRQVKTLIEGDVVREWGSGPHLKATVSVRGGAVVATWDNGAERAFSDRNGSVITMERVSV